jgi:hypothetical protein
MLSASCSRALGYAHAIAGRSVPFGKTKAMTEAPKSVFIGTSPTEGSCDLASDPKALTSSLTRKAPMWIETGIIVNGEM